MGSGRSQTNYKEKFNRRGIVFGEKGIESALLFDIDTIFKTAIKEAVSNNSNKENDFE